MYQTFIRKKCVVCFSKINPIKTFKNFPTHMCCLEKNEESYLDMEWGACQSCGCVQLLRLINQDDLYKFPHNNPVGKTWELHNKEFSCLIKQYNFNDIIDIGGANLKIANLICKNKNIKNYVVIDYSSHKYETKKINKKINMITGNAEKLNVSEKYDCVVMSHTFEHLYNPVQFLKNIRKNIKKNGKFIISVPNIKNQLLDNFLNAINFEHTYFIDDQYITQIFNNSGFILEKIIQFSKYNHFYVFEKNNKIINKNQLSSNNTIDIFNKFCENLVKEVTKINSILKDEKFYIFGAHIFTQFLINFGLNRNNIINILDNDINKKEKILFGTNIIVKSPEILSDQNKVNVVLRAAQYSEEITEQLLKINPQINII